VTLKRTAVHADPRFCRATIDRSRRGERDGGGGLAMRDGKTRKRTAETSGRDVEEFFSRYCATIVIIEGGAAGTEYPLDRTQLTMGRGPGVDLAFDDPAMSREHAALELVPGAFRIRDLGSTNGLLMNGSPCEIAKLKHGDRFQIGDYRFQYLLEEREQGPRAYELPEQ
jgi:hypothetical protein